MRAPLLSCFNDGAAAAGITILVRTHDFRCGCLWIYYTSKHKVQSFSLCFTLCFFCKQKSYLVYIFDCLYYDGQYVFGFLVTLCLINSIPKCCSRIIQCQSFSLVYRRCGNMWKHNVKKKKIPRKNALNSYHLNLHSMHKRNLVAYPTYPSKPWNTDGGVVIAIFDPYLINHDGLVSNTFQAMWLFVC